MRWVVEIIVVNTVDFTYIYKNYFFVDKIYDSINFYAGISQNLRKIN